MSDSRIHPRRIEAGPTAAPPADLVRALSKLQPREEHALFGILEALGYTCKQEAAPRVPATTRAAAVSSSPQTVRRDEDQAVTPVRKPQPSEISISKPAGSEKPDWMTTVTPLDVVQDPGAVFREQMPSLLLPQRERAVLIRAAAKYRDTGEVDVERAIEAVTANTPLQRVPRLPVASVSDGAQFLCDRGPAMEPFTLDAEHIVNAVLSVVGRDRVSIVNFVGCPTRGILRWNDIRPVKYRFPLAGQAVLAFSDLGVIRGAASESLWREWLAFGKQLQRRDSILTILFPGTKNRLPVELLRKLRVIALDRQTGVRREVAPPSAPGIYSA